MDSTYQPPSMNASKSCILSLIACKGHYAATSNHPVLVSTYVFTRGKGFTNSWNNCPSLHGKLFR